MTSLSLFAGRTVVGQVRVLYSPDWTHTGFSFIILTVNLFCHPTVIQHRLYFKFMCLNICDSPQLLLKISCMSTFAVSSILCEKICTVKPDISGHSKEDEKFVFNSDYRLMQVKSIAECSKRAFCNTFDLH